MKRFVLREKYVKLLISMSGRKATIVELAKMINVHTGHFRNVIDQWQRENLVSREIDNREYIIALTPKGEAISKKLAELMKLVDNYQEGEQ